MNGRVVVRFRVFLPAEDTQNEVEHEEGANQDECGEIDPWPFHSYSIIDLSEKAHFFVFIKEIGKCNWDSLPHFLCDRCHKKCT